jgi:hypothetical protein
MNTTRDIALMSHDGEFFAIWPDGQGIPIDFARPWMPTPKDAVQDLLRQTMITGETHSHGPD